MVAINALHGNSTRIDEEISVQSMFLDSANKHAHLIAVQYKDRFLTYQALDALSNQYANYLYSIGVCQFDKIGIFLDYDIDVVAIMLAVLKLGCAYLPIETAYPDDRINFMLSHGDVKCILTSRLLIGRIQDVKRAICIDSVPNILENTDPYFSLIPSQKNDPVYLLYTSGSTGNPKGAVLKQSGVVNLLRWYANTYHFSPDDRVLIISSLGFDLTQKNILGALISGARVVLCDIKPFNSVEIGGLFKANKISFVNCTPSAFYWLLDSVDIDYFETVRYVFLGGEAINPIRLSKTLNLPHTKIINTYGPTECSDIATTYSITKKDIQLGQDIPIGKAIDNIELQIVDEALNPVKIGVKGELLIGGIGVGSGYYKDTKQTSEKFIRFKKNSETYYKTGDLVYLSQDGNIYYCGRLDDQVKRLGNRIQLSEIESQLEKLLGVQQAAVVSIEKNTLSTLIAYLILNLGGIEIASIKKNLKEKLPAYMIPDEYIVIDKMPLNRHGKIDRVALKTLALEINTDNQLIFNNDEKAITTKLSNYWNELLSISGCYAEDNFFALGGYSILVFRLIAFIKSDFEIDIPLVDFYKNPTLKNILYQVNNHPKNQKIKNFEGETLTADSWYSLSHCQKRICFLCQLMPNVAFYNLPLAFFIKGRFSQVLFYKALEYVVKHHDALRTRFSVDNQKQYFLDENKFKLPVHFSDCRDQSDNFYREDMEKLANEPISLSDNTLWFVKIYQLNDDEHVIFFNFHHLLFDGASWRIFSKILNVVYSSQQANMENTYLYSDYLRARLDNFENEKLIFWENYLVHEKNNPTFIKSRYNIEKSRETQFSGKKVKRTLSQKAYDAIYHFSKTESVTVFSSLLSVYALCIQSFFDGLAVILNIPVENRADRRYENTIGCFINTILFKIAIMPEKSIRALVKTVHEDFYHCLSYSDVPFDEVIKKIGFERNPDENPVSTLLFSYQNNTSPRLHLNELLIEPLFIPAAYSRFDIEFQVWEDNGFVLDIFYNEAFCDEHEIDRVINQFEKACETISEYSELTLLSYIQNDIDKINASKTLIKKDNAKNDLFFITALYENAIKNPDNIALIDQFLALTYRDFFSLLKKAKVFLMYKNINKNLYVLFTTAFSFETVAMIVAAWTMGMIYVPVDPKVTGFRLEQIQSELKDFLLIDDRFIAEFLSFEAEQAAYIAPIETTIHEKNTEKRACLFYTSGTTGLAKGVLVTHTNLVSTFEGINAVIQLNENDRFLMLTSPAFDISLVECIFPLVVGASVFFHEKTRFYEKRDLQKFLINNAITFIQATPTVWRNILSKLPSTQLKISALVGGEQSSQAVFDELNEKFNTVYHFYGPTETTIWSFGLKIDKSQLNKANHIGLPLNGEHGFVVDAHLTVLPVGKTGELLVVGNGVTQGYFNQVEHPKFINFEFEGQCMRGYLTGDYVKYHNTHGFEFLGRIDNQIKINGVRINLQEIGEIVETLDAIEAVECIADKKDESNEIILFYKVSTAKRESLIKTYFERVSAVFESIYQNSPVNTAGWINEINREAIAFEFLIAMYKNIAQNILLHHPKRILEIGGGNGHLIPLLINHVSHYAFSELSQSACDYVKNTYVNANLYIFNDSIDSFIDRKQVYDCIIINSVIQYFPDSRYLIDFLKKANDLLSDTGFIYLGDIVSRKESNHHDELRIDPEEMVSWLNYFFPSSVTEIKQKPHSQAYPSLSDYRYDMLIHKNNVDAISPKLDNDSLDRLYESSSLNALMHQELANLLAHRLPYYLVPKSHYLVNEFPSKITGKIDIPALKRIVKSYKKPTYTTHFINNNPNLLSLWKSVLKCEACDLTKNFFELGGDSFLALELVRHVEIHFHVQIPLYAFYAYPYYSTLQDYVFKKESPNPDSKDDHRPIKTKSKRRKMIVFPGIDGEKGWFDELVAQDQVFDIFFIDYKRFFHAGDDSQKYMQLFCDYIEENILNRMDDQQDAWLIVGWSYGGLFCLKIIELMLSRMRRKPIVLLLDPMLSAAIQGEIIENKIDSLLGNGDELTAVQSAVLNNLTFSLKIDLNVQNNLNGFLFLPEDDQLLHTKREYWGKLVPAVVQQTVQADHFSLLQGASLNEILKRGIDDAKY